MIFSLFRSASQRSAEAVQTHINSLKGLDAEGLAGIALYCSYVRLAELRHIRAHASSEAYTKFVWLYYRPLIVETPFVKAAVDGLEQSLKKIERDQRGAAHNPLAQGFLGLLGAATQAWRNTWLGCLYGEVRCLSQEMWGLISLGFPLVSEVSLTLMHDPYFHAAPSEVEIFEAVTRDDGDGPDYTKLPEGFEPPSRADFDGGR